MDILKFFATAAVVATNLLVGSASAADTVMSEGAKDCIKEAVTNAFDGAIVELAAFQEIKPEVSYTFTFNVSGERAPTTVDARFQSVTLHGVTKRQLQSVDAFFLTEQRKAKIVGGVKACFS